MVESRILRIAFLGALFLSEHAFAAFCLPIPHFRYVGDKATDSKCTDNDIQSAINNMVCPGTTIVITREQTYTSQALLISDKSLALAGVGDGVPCGSSIGVCDPSVGCGGGGGGAPPAPAITLHGNGSASVITINGNSNVTLQSLELTGGGGSGGGGVAFNGSGALTLVDSSIVNNTASFGGGIYLSGGGVPGIATLTLGTGTIIEENTAGADGGGIYLGEATRLVALAPYTFIGYNHAPNGNGGGIAAEGPPPASADIGSPGYNGAPVIEFNDAAYGGGVAVVAQGPANQGYIVQVNLFATDPNNPGAISSNTATQGGGGIYVKSNFDSGAGAGNNIVGGEFCATSFRIDGNVAPEGSAIFSESNFIAGYFGGYASLNPQNGCEDLNYSINLSSLGSVPCVGVSCNTVNSNGSLDASNQPTTGAAIFVNHSASLNANRFVMRFNQGGHAIHLVNAYDGNIVDGLLADNTGSAELIRAENTYIDIDSCTLANNSLGGPSVIYSTSPVDPYIDFQNSIIDQPGLVTLNADNHLNVVYLLSNDISTLPYYGTLGTPTYVNAAAGDYHLQLTSLGVDFAPSLSYANATPALDLDGKPRAFDIPSVANHYGPRDLGAYERSPACYRADTLFCDGLEGIY